MAREKNIAEQAKELREMVEEAHKFSRVIQRCRSASKHVPWTVALIEKLRDISELIEEMMKDGKEEG